MPQFFSPEKFPMHVPDFRNQGIVLRTILLVNFLLVLGALFVSRSLPDFPDAFIAISTFAQPLLILSLLVLYVFSPFNRKLPVFWGVYCMLGELVLVAIAGYMLITQLLPMLVETSLLKLCLLVVLFALVVLSYFSYRQRSLAPAIAEARLQALQARIRPHFLFNSINAVLSIVRTDPRRAETALEDMADLFRVLMAENRDLVPLADELALCRQYLALEKLRLDERLQIEWQIDDVPPDALVPPLVLQPLLENAVYHGIEPLENGGSIRIQLYTHQRHIHLLLSNPLTQGSSHHQGNKMALKNIRERLALHYDAEASLESRAANGQYTVHIVLPYRSQK